MRRRALVVGAQTGELEGVHQDAETMTAILSERGFEVDTRITGNATQAGIRDGWRRLITDTGADDAAAIYFSGHGNVAQVFSAGGIALPEQRFIVPTDYGDSTPGDFRGITAIELSVAVAELTEKTPNVTVILDCCHAVRMVRNDLRVKAWPNPTYLDIAEHVGMLRALGLNTDVVHPVANPHAVRLLACAPTQSAYEFSLRRGVRAGAFTDSIRVALEDAGPAQVTWSTLIQRIQDRVKKLAEQQRPEVEGPFRRLLFDLTWGRESAVLPVISVRSDRVALPGAALLGVAVGDEFAVTAAGVPSATVETTVARAIVTKTNGVTVEAEFHLCDGHTTLPPMAEAHPVKTSMPRGIVRVSGAGTVAEGIRGEINAVPTLRAVGPDDPVGDEPILAEVAVAEELSLWDGGPTALAAASADQAGVQQIVADLGRLGRAAVLRRLAPQPAEAFANSFVVEWGRVVDHKQQPLPRSKALLHVGDSVYLRLRNESRRSLYFFVFDIGVAHTVRLLTPDVSGRRVDPGEELTIGERIDGVVTGSPLTWPAGLAPDRPRPETLLVLVSAAPHDLSGLTHGDPSAAVSSTGSARLAATMRDLDVENPDQAEFAIVRLDFDLSPAPAPVAGKATFLIDERPHPSSRELRSRHLTPPPDSVAVRLIDLVVNRNRALLGADIRVDALVLTGADGQAGMPVYRAETAWFNRIRDGQRLPLDDMLVYHGPATGYLDLAWWVSRDRTGSRALSDLLRDRLTDPSVLESVQTLSSLAIAAPHAALAVTAISAGAVIINTAYELLSQAVGDTIGLYRTSFLASEGLGVGRHPPVGSLTAQDFSFSYEIVDTG